MSVRSDGIPLPWKRMLSHDEAAAYCGFKSTAQFLTQVRSRVPAVNFGKYERWDRHQLDAWLDTLSGGNVSDATLGIVEALKAGHPKAIDGGRASENWD